MLHFELECAVPSLLTYINQGHVAEVVCRLVTTLPNAEQKPGYHSLTWNRQDAKGRSCACGVYFCTLSAENQRFSWKVVLTE